jgi:integrase
MHEEDSMGIKYNEVEKTYHVSFYKRHPITKQPVRAARGGIKSKAEAHRIYTELVVLVERKLHEKVAPKWSVLIEQFRAAMIEQGLTQKTVDNYCLCLRAHTLEPWGDRCVDSITTEEIRSLIKIRAGDRAPSHQKNILKFIRSVFKYAVGTGILQRNPTPEMKFRTGDKIKRVLTEEQARTLLQKAKEYNWEWYPHVATALYTGMRNGELYALTWDKVNLNERTMLVDGSWNKKDGFKSTKSGNDRVVEIAPPLLGVLKELKLKSTDSTFVLPRIDQWDSGYQAAALRMFLTGLGLPVVRFHDLRATWATLMLGKGVQPAKVMVMGGWNDLKTMMIYMRKAGIDIRGITDVLSLHNPSREGGQIVSITEKR